VELDLGAQGPRQLLRDEVVGVDFGLGFGGQTGEKGGRGRLVNQTTLSVDVDLVDKDKGAEADIVAVLPCQQYCAR
jgi:hypothetical protein